MSDHEVETITEENTPPKVVPQITTIINISTKFPYLKKGDAKSMTTDNDGNLKIRPPVTAEEHQQVQREEKARTILLSALLDEHMGDFYHKIDARDIWNDIKARFGGNAESKKMQKSLLKQKLPPSWSGIALILKTKGGLEYISFDDLYNKLKFLEIDTKGYLSSSLTLFNAAFVSTAGLSQGNLSYQESRNGGYTTTLSVSPGNTEPRSLENFGMVAGIEIALDADSEGEVVYADNVILAGVSVSAGDVAAAVVSLHSETEFA
nr:xylulose kinase-1 [Tanacetum cinerariifolium]